MRSNTKISEKPCNIKADLPVGRLRRRTLLVYTADVCDGGKKLTQLYPNGGEDCDDDDGGDQRAEQRERDRVMVHGCSVSDD